jgi:type II secretory pathway component PulK
MRKSTLVIMAATMVAVITTSVLAQALPKQVFVQAASEQQKELQAIKNEEQQERQDLSKIYGNPTDGRSALGPYVGAQRDDTDPACLPEFCPHF